MIDKPKAIKKVVKLLPNTGGENDTLFVLGRTGSGKTTLIANLISERADRFVIFDVKQDYVAEYFGDDVVLVNDYNSFVEQVNKGVERIIFDLSAYQESQEDVLNASCIFLFAFQIENKKEMKPLTISFDEFNKFVKTSHCCAGIRDVIERGRSVNIRKIFGAQWYGTIPPFARDSFSEIYAFQHTDNNGLMLLSVFGFDAEVLKNLPRYHCAHSSPDGVKILQLVPAKFENDEQSAGSETQ